MINFFDQVLVEFSTFVLIRITAALPIFRPGSRSDNLEETGALRSVTSPNLAAAITASNVRILRLSTSSEEKIAVARFVFPRTSIFIDFRQYPLSSNLREFILAHELGHVRGRHPLKKLTIECAMFAVLGTAALELSLGFDSVQLAALVAVPTIVLGFFSVVAPAVRLIAQRMEFEADRFGATFVGVTCAIDALRELKGIVPQWNRTAISSDIEDRIAALTRYEATSTGRLNRY